MGGRVSTDPADTYNRAAATFDGITLSSDRKTVSVILSTQLSLDEVRIITAVPEPSSLALLAVGGLGLLACVRRRTHLNRLCRVIGVRTACRALICILVLAGATATAKADFVFTYQADADPTTEGFTGGVVSDGSSTFGSIANDLGNPAWSVTGTTQDSQYAYASGALSPSQLSDVANHGFTLTMVARALPGIAPTYDTSQPVGIAGSGLNTGAQRFDIFLGLDSNGDTVAFLPTADDAIGPGGSLVGAGPSYTLTGAGNGYHIYTLVYDPVTELADLFVDGIDRIQGYAGNMSFKANTGLYFGAASGGQGNFNFVQVVSVPEPSSFVLLAVSGLGLFAYIRRRRNMLAPRSAV